MDKKLFIKNRPLDVNDVNDMQNWTEDALKKTMASMYSPGIVTGLYVSPSSGMILKLDAGRAFDSDYNFINVISTQSITIAASEANPRYDIIVVRHKNSVVDNVDTGNIYGLGTSMIYSQNKLDSYEVLVLKGTASAAPVEPSIPTNYVALAKIYVGANVSSISASNITDIRSFININGTEAKHNATLVNGTNSIKSNNKTPLKVLSTKGKTVVNYAPKFGAWTKSTSLTVNSDFKATLTVSDGTRKSSSVQISTTAGKQYTLSGTITGTGARIFIDFYSAPGSYLSSAGLGTFTVPSGATFLHIGIDNGNSNPVNGTFVFENISLVEGTVALPCIDGFKGIINPTIEIKANPLGTTDFNGKIAGSVVENPNKHSYYMLDTLMAPNNSMWVEASSERYEYMSKLDGTLWSYSANISGRMAQHLFSFNLIQYVERKYGTIPAVDIASKVAWLKVNIKNITVNWYGKGSSPTGNKATLSVYGASQWYIKGSTTSNIIQKVPFKQDMSIEGAITFIQSDGFMHWLAYAEASDGVTSSIIETDYISLDVELKSDSLILVKSREVIETNLHSLNGVSDEIFRDVDGKLKKRTRFAERILDGTFPWTFTTDGAGYKAVGFTMSGHAVNENRAVTKYDGKILKNLIASDPIGTSGSDTNRLISDSFSLTILDTESGWGETYTPTVDEIKAYFNGWKMYESTGGGSSVYNGTGTKRWIARNADGTIDGNTISSTLPITPAPLAAPYKLAYQLANEITEEISTVNQAILEEGTNTVELKEGIVVKEKANPFYYSNFDAYYINHNGLGTVDIGLTNILKRTAKTIIAVYENDKLFTKYTTFDGSGQQGIKILNADFNRSAIYHVTYAMLPENTVKSESITVEYSSSLKSIVDNNTNRISEHEERLDNLHTIYAKKIQENWIPIALQNGAINVGSSFTASYMKDEFGFIHIRGFIKCPTTTPGLVIGTIAYKPDKNISFACVSASVADSTGAYPCTIDINTGGQICLGRNVKDAWVQMNFIFSIL